MSKAYPKPYDYNLDLWRVQPECLHLHELAVLLKDTPPQLWSPTITQLLPLIKWYYEYNGAGGFLHVAIDDGNLADVYIDDSIRRAYDEGDIIGYYLALLLRTMSEKARHILREQLFGRNVQP